MHDTLIDEFGGAPGVRDDGAWLPLLCVPSSATTIPSSRKRLRSWGALPTITPSWTATSELHSGPPASSEHNLRATPELSACRMLSLMA